MSVLVAPGAELVSRFSAGIANTGLVGTVRFRLLDADVAVDDPVIGPTTGGITEDPTGSGDYLWRGTAPSTLGRYFPAWDLGSGQLVYDEDVVITRDRPVVVDTGSLYFTKAELRVSLNLDDDDGDDDELDLACATASRAIDAFKRSFYYPATQTRYYTSDGSRRLRITPLNALTSLTIDADGDGVYETTWTAGTEFVLDPANAAVDGRPYESIVLRRGSSAQFPLYEQAIKVVGSFGWAETPAQVKTAAKLLAARLYKRRETPYAMVVAEVAANLVRTDPDVAGMLADVPPIRSGLTSVQLG